jgi:putative FmdB family regulatory protein
MPTYEYACIDCKHQYEKREGFDAPALQKCPKCEGTARRVIHAPPIVFKGSGFYVTDSRKSDSASESEASGEKATTKSDAVSKKADSDAKAESPKAKEDSSKAESAAAT